jgi:hypothetical protein
MFENRTISRWDRYAVPGSWTVHSFSSVRRRKAVGFVDSKSVGSRIGNTSAAPAKKSIFYLKITQTAVVGKPTKFINLGARTCNHYSGDTPVLSWRWRLSQPMNLSDTGQAAVIQSPDSRASYSAPGLRRVTPEAAKEMLLRHSDVNDPEVKSMLECIEQLQNPKGS